MATTLFGPSAVTLPAGTAFSPGQNGGALPAGLVHVDFQVDTANMPAGSTIKATWQVSAGGNTWSDLDSAIFDAGSHPDRFGTGTTTLESLGMPIPQSPYPAKWRVQTVASVACSVTVTITAD